MEHSTVSLHEVKIWNALVSNPGKWMTNKELEVAAKVSGRTTRAHTSKLVNLGLVEQAEVFPGYRFRVTEKADKRNGGYLRRLQAAADVFGVGAL